MDDAAKEAKRNEQAQQIEDDKAVLGKHLLF